MEENEENHHSIGAVLALTVQDREKEEGVERRRLAKVDG